MPVPEPDPATPGPDRGPLALPGHAHAYSGKVRDLYTPLDPATGALAAIHHPFTAPNPDDLHLLDSAPERVRALAYDVVLNGTELGGGSMAELSPLFPRKPINVSDRLRDLPRDGTIPGLDGWQWIHTPGHAPGHVSFWNAATSSLIAGDAISATRQRAGGLSCAHPNHADAKKPKIAAVAAASRTNSVIMDSHSERCAAG